MGFDLDKYIGNATTTGTKATELRTRYADHPVVLYAVDKLSEEAVKKNSSEKINVPELTSGQLAFIDLMDSNEYIVMSDACKALGIRLSEIVIWKRNSRLFEICMDILKEAEAEQAESVLWSNATQAANPDSISRMFALKARKPEYRENAPAQGDTVVNVRISVEGQEFNTEAGIKIVSESDIEKE